MNESVDTARKIRVMIVDDSTIIRGSIRQILKSDAAIEIVSSLSDGSQAVAAVERVDPDVVILDIEMPVMDGITALQKMLEIKPELKAIICSTLSDRNAQISLKALALGATDCVLKPSSAHDIQNKESFHRELLHSVRVFGRLAAAGVKAAQRKDGNKNMPAGVSLRRPGTFYSGRPNALAIGCSTGGPQALHTLLPYLKDIPVPVFITQHMPPVFTRILAENLSAMACVPCHEAEEDMAVKPGNVYIAKGGVHMAVESDEEGRHVIKLQDGPPESFCIPSVEPMLRSMNDLYGNKMLVVILTGMGNDGLEACRQHAGKNGRIIAQDEQSSVVWGMPGAIATQGLCASVAPLPEIGRDIRSAFHLPALEAA